MHRIVLVAVVALTLALAPASAHAAHLGNSKADVMGTGVEPDADGKALVNYSDGTGRFNGGIRVDDLNPGETYTYSVRRANGSEVVICSGSANRQGLFSCHGQQVDIPAPGFVQAVVRNTIGVEVANGAFTERRGNCREPDQAGSQCQAPGQA